MGINLWPFTKDFCGLEEFNFYSCLLRGSLQRRRVSVLNRPWVIFCHSGVRKENPTSHAFLKHVSSRVIFIDYVVIIYWHWRILFIYLFIYLFIHLFIYLFLAKQYDIAKNNLTFFVKSLLNPIFQFQEK